MASHTLIGMRNTVVAARCCLTLCCLLVAGCGTTVSGSATWPGARLTEAALGASDVPPGVQYDRITEVPGQPDGAGAPGPMLSRPQGCSDALTKVMNRAFFEERVVTWEDLLREDAPIRRKGDPRAS